MPKKELITCIYCKLSKESSREHAVQKALGGNLTIPCVCRECNNGLSSIDKALAERSLISMLRIVAQVADAEKIELGGTHYWTPPGEETIEVDVGFGMRASPKPQLMFSRLSEKMEMRSCVESRDDYIVFFQVIRDWIASGQIEQIPLLEAPKGWPNYTLPRLVLHKGKFLFFRAPDDFPDVQQFQAAVVGYLKDNIDAIEDAIKASATNAPVQTDNQPQVHISAKMSLNDVNRAVAKIGFNLLAAIEGADFVLQSAFDPIRDYIRGIDIRNSTPSTAEEIAYDPRFVKMVPAGERPPFPKSGQSCHTCLLIYSFPTLFAGIDFYGQQYYLVKLADIELKRHILHVHSFNHEEKSNRAMTLAEITDSIQGQLQE